MQKRDYDLIIYGASGFTGRLVAEYILNQYGLNGDLKWAIAGRNRAKLEEIHTFLDNDQVPLVIADSQDKASLDAMTQQTKVICTTVGPYAKYGSKLVASCVENGTHYCDLTGEVQWFRRMIDQHHEAAQAQKVKIVHCCGFDSIPSEMGVHFLQKSALERFGQYAQHIKFGLKGMSGGMSGGTVASMNNMLAEAEEDKSLYKLLADPYSLNPRDAEACRESPDLTTARYDKDFQSWISPFLMAAINTRVVRRSHALEGFPYGKDFVYEEATLNGSGISGRLSAYAMTAGMGLMMLNKPGSVVAKVADRFLPDPGEGPSKEQRENGFFNIHFIGKLRDGRLIKVKVKGDRDPGYGSTCKMLGESAVCLAKDKLPTATGILTPSVAMGDALLERLEQNSGLSFEVVK